MRSHACESIFVAFMVMFSVAAAVLYYPMKVLAQGQFFKYQCTSTISANFNGTSIPGGSSIWFVSSLTPGAQLTSSGSIYVKSFTISFSASGKTYICYNFAPTNILNFSSSATIAQLIYYQGNNTWISTFPLGLLGNVFLAPCILPVPAGGLPGGIQPVTWTMTFESHTQQPIVWQWGAAVYSQFPPAQESGCPLPNCIAGGHDGTMYQEVGAKPTDDVSSQDCVNPSIPGSGTTTCSAPYGDRAGTPEGVNSSNQPWKQFVIGGALGDGGSNWTGSLTGTGSCTPTPPS
jgi:hypothetical protein